MKKRYVTDGAADANRQAHDFVRETLAAPVAKHPIRIPHNVPMAFRPENYNFVQKLQRIIDKYIPNGARHLMKEDDAIAALNEFALLFRERYGLNTVEQIEDAIVDKKLPCQREADLVEMWIDIADVLPRSLREILSDTPERRAAIEAFGSTLFQNREPSRQCSDGGPCLKSE